MYNCTALNTGKFKLTFDLKISSPRNGARYPCSRGKSDAKWNDSRVIFCFVERGDANTKEQESWCNWRPHGVDGGTKRARANCV